MEAAAGYLRRHPEYLARAALDFIGMRASIPMAALRWLTTEALAGAGGDAELVLEPVPPGLRLAGTLEAMRTRMRVSAVCYVDRVLVDDQHARIDLRFEEIDLKVLSDTKTQIGALIRSGALDVSQIGDLLAELPDIPGFVVDAHGNRMSVDLMRHPTLRANPRLREMVGLVSALVTVRAVETDPGTVGVRFRPLPRGLLEAVEQVGDHVIEPGLERVRAAVERSAGQGPLGQVMRQLGVSAGTNGR